MKERELRQAAKCEMCGNMIGRLGNPIFYRVTVQMYAIDVAACQRQQGLAMQLGGNGAVAMAMGPNEDLAQPFGAARTFTACATCAADDTNVSELDRIGSERADGQEET